MARPRFQALPGTRDLLSPDTDRMRALVEVFADEAEKAGFGQIVLPMFEDLGVFTRIGESTDIVTKELYDFEDNGGRRIALRPEFTASVCRAYAQNRPLPPWKAWYAGPAFRQEKAQKGRYRQFDQVGSRSHRVPRPRSRHRTHCSCRTVLCPDRADRRDVAGEHVGRRRRPTPLSGCVAHLLREHTVQN